MRIDLAVRSPVSRSIRVRQLRAMFDVPPAAETRCEWHLDVPLDARPWNVGLIVGPSGAGKSSVARALFGEAVDRPQKWGGASVIDDFGPKQSIERVAEVCQAVGFNTIPAWLRPFAVLSTGERFRAELARRLLECPDPIVVDEFSSVVDRQVAQIGAWAVQKWARRHGRRFVAVTCHYDILDWLQPDWTLEPATGEFAWREVEGRELRVEGDDLQPLTLDPQPFPHPPLECEVARVHRAAWALFAPFHYLTGHLHVSAQCYVLFCRGRPASFVGLLTQPNPHAKDIRTVSRAVTLPDWQGLGLIFHLMDRVGAAHKALGLRLHVTPAHPGFIHACDRSATWRLVRRPGTFHPAGARSKWRRVGSDMIRPCATFCYAGAALADRRLAADLVRTSGNLKKMTR